MCIDIYARYYWRHYLLSILTEPVCPTGEPLPGRTCGGLLPGNQCPRGYTCVGELVPVDGPGVCCPEQPGQYVRILHQYDHSQNYRGYKFDNRDNNNKH